MSISNFWANSQTPTSHHAATANELMAKLYMGAVKSVNYNIRVMENNCDQKIQIKKA
ncbi:MAG: hypothetical protein AB4080_15130 [Trichodesmium sp.]